MKKGDCTKVQIKGDIDIPHKGSITVAYRKFRLEYPSGCTPARHESVDQHQLVLGAKQS